LIDDCKMRGLSSTRSHEPRVFAAALFIISLSIVDACLTLELVDRGAEELNPIMAYYLQQSPLIFFAVKYFLTCAAIIMILHIGEFCIFGNRLGGEVLFAFFILVLALVVQWQLVLLHFISG